jgi:hypothetical protein
VKHQLTIEEIAAIADEDVRFDALREFVCGGRLSLRDGAALRVIGANREMIIRVQARRARQGKEAEGE